MAGDLLQPAPQDPHQLHFNLLQWRPAPRCSRQNSPGGSDRFCTRNRGLEVPEPEEAGELSAHARVGILESAAGAGWRPREGGVSLNVFTGCTQKATLWGLYTKQTCLRWEFLLYELQCLPPENDGTHSINSLQR